MNPGWRRLLTSSGRPGFYFRVLREGEVGGGDEIVKVGEAEERMSVAEINALLYLPNHARNRLERALRIEALPQGWRSSFEALLQSQANQAANTGNAGLAPAAAAHPAAPGFRRHSLLRGSLASLRMSSSLTMQSADGQALAQALPGQYVVLRLQPNTGGPPIFRSYSLSGPVSTERYRISVKIEPMESRECTWLSMCKSAMQSTSACREASFFLQPPEKPVVLLSAGIGATPVLAMLHALAEAGSTQQVLLVTRGPRPAASSVPRRSSSPHA